MLLQSLVVGLKSLLVCGKHRMRPTGACKGSQGPKDKLGPTGSEQTHTSFTAPDPKDIGDRRCYSSLPQPVHLPGPG